MKLRQLFHEHGYRLIKPGRFIEYNLLFENKRFLNTDSVISFMDADGHLMALKPDSTLAIVKGLKDSDDTERLSYSDDVYRLSAETGGYVALNQVGLELIGGDDANAEIVSLALESLSLLGGNAVLDISHMGFLAGLLDMEPGAGMPHELLTAIRAKDFEAVCALLGDDDRAKLVMELIALHGSASETLELARALAVNDATRAAFAELEQVASLSKDGVNLNLDFSVVNHIEYYNGLILRGYIEGCPSAVLSGGRYDGVMRRFGKKRGAIGFAVTLNELRAPDKGADNKGSWLGVALPKGRLGEQARTLLRSAGVRCPDTKDRRLIVDDERNKLRFFLVKPADVPVYVERGVADIGIVGKDLLLERRHDVFELCKLNIGKCHVAVAAADGSVTERAPLRVATKYVNIAKRHFAGRDVELIRLNGSIELAPLLGLSDVILDIVETGETLKANGLQVIENVAEISARLIANKSAYRFKTARMCAVKGSIERAGS